MTAHAILSASSSYRWLHCPPSARLNTKVRDEASPYALEGSAAHELAEYKLKSALSMKADDPTKNLTYYSKEMEDTPPIMPTISWSSLKKLSNPPLTRLS